MDAAAPSLLRLLARRGLIAVFGVAVVGGGGRLVHDEVSLTSVVVDRDGLRSRLSQQQTEAQRSARLELDLAQLKEERGALARERARAEAKVTELEQGAATARTALAELEAARDRAASEGAAAVALAEARAADLTRVQVDLAAREAALATAREERAALDRKAAALETDLAARGRDLDEARAREAALEGDLAAERRARAEAVAQLERRLGETEAALAAARESAKKGDERLERLGQAGVNWQRLTGERPMPDVRATVLQVDLEATPPNVVIDAGEAAGLERGDALIVVRDGQEVARVEVDDVRGAYASGRIVRAQRGARVRPGDTVRSATRGTP